MQSPGTSPATLRLCMLSNWPDDFLHLRLAVIVASFAALRLQLSARIDACQVWRCVPDGTAKRGHRSLPTNSHDRQLLIEARVQLVHVTLCQVVAQTLACGWPLTGPCRLSLKQSFANAHPATQAVKHHVNEASHLAAWMRCEPPFHCENSPNCSTLSAAVQTMDLA